MARGKATFSTMQELNVDVRRDLPKNCGGDVDMDLEEDMNVEKGFSNNNFRATMSARNKLRKRHSKPKYPTQPVQGRQGMQMNPGKIATATPAENPTGPKTKGWKKTAALSVGLPLGVSVVGADVANRIQDRRGDKKRMERHQRFQNKLKPKKGQGVRKGLFAETISNRGK